MRKAGKGKVVPRSLLPPHTLFVIAVRFHPRCQRPCFRRRSSSPCAGSYWLLDSICGLCFRLGRVGKFPYAVGFDAMR